ncbi:hypothetical protein [Massilia consociata]|uniref:hypothetical protein n=1 Tax=Massilia consociata TaxID=760117 RepID=UPI0036D33937
MMDARVYWVLLLALAGVVALCLAVRFRDQRWPRVIAATAVGAIVSLYIGDAGATRSILLAGVILAVGSAAARRR